MQREQICAASCNQQETGSAFAGLLTAMEVLPGALRGGKPFEFITNPSALHMWAHRACKCYVISHSNAILVLNNLGVGS